MLKGLARPLLVFWLSGIETVEAEGERSQGMTCGG